MNTKRFLALLLVLMMALVLTEEGLQIRVEALTGEERTEAQALSGLTLERGEQATEITENRTYPS